MIIYKQFRDYYVTVPLSDGDSLRVSTSPLYLDVVAKVYQYLPVSAVVSVCSLVDKTWHKGSYDALSFCFCALPSPKPVINAMFAMTLPCSILLNLG